MVKCSWSDFQSSSGDIVHVFMSSFRRQTLKSPRARFSLCVVNETAQRGEQTDPYGFESLSWMSNTDQSAARRF